MKIAAAKILVWFVAFAFALAGRAWGEESTPTEVEYLRDVKPLLRSKCYACHAALKQESGLRLDTADLAKRGGESGPAVVPGDADASPLIQRITATDPAERMPSEAPPLADNEIALIRAWITQGATSPANEKQESDPREHWAFRLPVRPAIPPFNRDPTGSAPASDRESARALPVGSRLNGEGAIDAFIAQKQAQHGLAPRPVASRETQLRRVYLDLIGLPPTPEELSAFLADESPEAYDLVVDRLLASPQYGERWGRHWMDVWRYSDWYGRRNVPDVWNSAPQIWRWRDWIVRSLNEDRGYDRMIQAMLAADEISPDDPEATVATGYLIRNWYALNPNDWMRANVEHTAKAFLGLTVNCAHCHDHKYDPIAQDDYFRLRAFFEPIAIRQDREPREADPGAFQEYDYSVLRKIQRLGAVRIFDKNPAAPTWFYSSGDERNRVAERGSFAPGVPAAFGGEPLHIEPVALPPRAWYPGLQPAIQETVLNERRAALAQAETELVAARKSAEEALPALRVQLATAEAEFAAAASVAAQAGQPVALAGKQSLVLDATAGRRIAQRGLSEVQSLPDGAVLRFQLRIVADAHFNFQLAKDAVQGLTAAYIGFDRGRILAYQPGTFNEFEVGRYDVAGGQNRFEVTLVLHTAEDRCSLTVRSAGDDRTLVDAAATALNGWYPVGDPTKAITFDARPGSIAAVDEIELLASAGTTGEGGVAPARLVYFDFEPPTYADGRDVVGIDGWTASSFNQPPATSIVSSIGLSPQLTGVMQAVRSARAAVQAQELKISATEAGQSARQAELVGVEARIAADRVKYGETAGDADQAARDASRAEREAAKKTAAAALLAQEQLLAAAEAKPVADASRVAEIDAAGKKIAEARPALEKATAALGDASLDGAYSPLGPTYPQTSTGRRKALAEWIASPNNPLTARVAVNHIWMRHFHAPLVASVFDFGRNGAAPTHPELLDWLAVEFMESGWSMKHLHRLIVTSQAYRRDSNAGAEKENAARDPENKFLWRMNAGRMEAEVVRDSLLYAVGRLDLQQGGQELENEQSLATRRRSLYYGCHPESNGKSELGVLFDAADAAECYRRTRSIVPQQALALTNSALVHEVSGELAARIWNALPADSRTPPAFIAEAYRTTLTRVPTRAEIDLCAEFLAHQTDLAAKANPAEADVRARSSLVRALLNHNDFIAIR